MQFAVCIELVYFTEHYDVCMYVCSPARVFVCVCVCVWVSACVCFLFFDLQYVLFFDCTRVLFWCVSASWRIKIYISPNKTNTKLLDVLISTAVAKMFSTFDTSTIDEIRRFLDLSNLELTISNRARNLEAKFWRKSLYFCNAIFACGEHFNCMHKGVVL